MELEDRINDLSKRLRGIPFRREARYRLSYGFDATGRKGRCDAVVFPQSLEDLRKTVIEARRAGVPLFMRGAGTGFSGGSVPSGGIVVSTENLDKILGLDEESLTVTVDSEQRAAGVPGRTRALLSPRSGEFQGVDHRREHR
jgi:FAD/FMN-containing dehydrogenase